MLNSCSDPVKAVFLLAVRHTGPLPAHFRAVSNATLPNIRRLLVHESRAAEDPDGVSWPPWLRLHREQRRKASVRAVRARTDTSTGQSRTPRTCWPNFRPLHGEKLSCSAQLWAPPRGWPLYLASRGKSRLLNSSGSNNVAKSVACLSPNQVLVVTVPLIARSCGPAALLLCVSAEPSPPKPALRPKLSRTGQWSHQVEKVQFTARKGETAALPAAASWIATCCVSLLCVLLFECEWNCSCEAMQLFPHLSSCWLLWSPVEVVWASRPTCTLPVPAPLPTWFQPHYPPDPYLFQTHNLPVPSVPSLTTYLF